MAALTLSQFLIDNPQNALREEFFLSQRFKDAGFKFTISAMSGEQFANYQKEAIAVGRHKNVSFDTKRFNELVVLNHTLVPDFRSAEDMKAAGCARPEDYLYRSLKAGEIMDLASRISKLSGFEEDAQGMVDEVKNS